MLGISTYLKDLDIDYLKNAANIGAKYVFTSLHIPEEDFSDLPIKLPLLLKTCQECGLILVPDVSPVTFEKLGVKPNDTAALKELGISALRLDYGFEDIAQLVSLQEDFHLMLNASVVNRPFLEKAKAGGVDFTRLQVAHNFYPKTDTGLSLDRFVELNKVFADYDLPILTFVPGDALKRFPLYQGLPTIEKHRGTHPYVAAVELLSQFGVSDIMIGDSLASLETLEMIQLYLTTKTLTLPIFLSGEKTTLFDKPLRVRRDMPERVVRLVTDRIPDIPVGKTLDRKRGMITMENGLGGRYSGEIQLCKTDLPFSATTNVLGFIHPEFVELLDYIDRDTIVKFQPLYS